jgi:diketogulonate reductase-like aldo/keto reductase
MTLTMKSTIELRSGRSMPVLGLGTWQLTRDTPGTVAEALRLGYRLIDTSGDYGTQAAVGEAIRGGGIARTEIYFQTKVEEDEDAYAAVGRNLEEAGLDYADMILIHRPPRRGAGTTLWKDLLRARNERLALDVGVSNYSIEQMEELADATGELPAVNQIEWTPFGWSREMVQHCRERRIVIQAYSPLTRTERLRDTRLTEIAAAHRKTPAQVLLRWNLQLGIVPLPKANRHEHLVENADVFDFELAEAELEEIGALNEHYSSLGSSLAYA